MKSTVKRKVINVLNLERCINTTDTNIIDICFIMRNNKHKIFGILYGNIENFIVHIKNTIKDNIDFIIIDSNDEPNIKYKISGNKLMKRLESILEDAKYSNKVFEKVDNKLRMTFKASIFSLYNKEALLTISELDEYFINHEFKILMSFDELPIKQSESFIDTSGFYINDDVYLLTNSQNYGISVYSDEITKSINYVLRKLAKYIQNEYGIIIRES